MDFYRQGKYCINPSFTTLAAVESSHHRVSNVVLRLDCFLSLQSPAEINGTPVPSMKLNSDPNFFHNKCINIRLSFQMQEAVCLFLIEKYS